MLCHGYSAGKHNVDPLAYHLAAEGYIALAFDFLGHKLGASSSPLARADDLLSNALDAIAFARKQPGVGRVVIGGHSMGAATAIGAAVSAPDVNGVIAMCTALGRGRLLEGTGLLNGLVNRTAYVDGAPPQEITAVMDGFTARIGQIAPRPLLVIAARKTRWWRRPPSASSSMKQAAQDLRAVDATHTDCAERSRFVVLRWLKASGFEYAH